MNEWMKFVSRADSDTCFHKGEVSSKMTYIFIGHFELAYFLENLL